MANEPEQLSPEWWLRRLHKQLIERRPVLEKASNYYDGAHNLAFASEKFLDAFGGLFRAFADNWCEVVVDAVEERLNVEGFRIGDDPSGDGEAWDMWQDNDMDAQSPLAHVDSLVQGLSYATVWTRDTNGTPEITVESAMSTIVDRHPKFRNRRQAALRCWGDDWGYEHAELFLPDSVHLYRSRTKRGGIVDSARCWWDADQSTGADVDEDGAMKNPLGVVPVVELQNRPRLYRSRRVGWAAHSELRAVIPLQDAVNKLVADMLVASEFAAYPQRHLTGYEAEEDPKTGEVKPPDYRSGPGNLWWSEGDKSKFGQFDAADLANFVKAIEMVIQHIASISRTPPHYLSASADRLSGESIKAAETGLVAKARRKSRHLGAAWEEVIRLAGMVASNDRIATATKAETIWADPESRTESQHIDATVKKKDLDIPLEQLWEDVGYSPQQIARFPAMRAREAMLNLVNAATQLVGGGAEGPPADDDAA